MFEFLAPKNFVDIGALKAKEHPLWGLDGIFYAFFSLFFVNLYLNLVMIVSRDTVFSFFSVFSAQHKIAITFCLFNLITSIVFIHMIFRLDKNFKKISVYYILYGFLINLILIFSLKIDLKTEDFIKQHHDYYGVVETIFSEDLKDILWFVFRWMLLLGPWFFYLIKSERMNVNFEHVIFKENSKIPGNHALEVPVAESWSWSDSNKLTDNAITSEDKLWELALLELDSPARVNWLWAKLFSEAEGNENLARANYIKIRVSQGVK